MSSYAESTRFLYDLQKFGVKLGLTGIKSLLRVLDDPHLAYPSIHIAGSNGKGSTSALLASIFSAAGYKTGLYTSPHLIDFRERIRIDGKPISKRSVANLTERLRPSIVANRSTFFEATTAMAFAHFAKSKIDIAIIETGIGGRLDATNVICPLLSIITNISLEHAEILGPSLERIAKEKAGIIKRGVPCITGVTHSGALQVLKSVAARQRARLIRTNSLLTTVKDASLRGTIVDVHTKKRLWRRLRLSLPGMHQIENVKLALQAVDVINESNTYSLTENAVRIALRDVRKFTGFVGRLSVIRRKPLVIADVAHNADGMFNLSHSLQALGIRECFLVFGVLMDKDFKLMVRHLAPFVRRAVVVAPKTERARPVRELLEEFERRRVPVERGVSVAEGVKMALSMSPRSAPRLITGSHFVVAEALHYLRQKKA